MPTKTPTSLENTKKWFSNDIIPQRTTSAGFSGNRLWKSPRAIFSGNIEDPNGLCGDAAAFVVDEFFNEYNDYITSDGYQIGLVLWQGSFSNHIANLMLLKNKTGPETYKWDAEKKSAVLIKNPRYCSPGKNQPSSSYTSSDILGLYVYDLYYKKITSVKDWWFSLDSDFGGHIKIGQLHNIDD